MKYLSLKKISKLKKLIHKSKFKVIKYNKFAEDYHNKRRRPWRDFESYLDKLKGKGLIIKGTIIDIGCANGRNFEIFKDSQNRLIGIDNSIEFLDIAKTQLQEKDIAAKEQKKIQLVLADMNHLPLRPTNKVDGVFSIASLHHIKSKSKRHHVINQLFNLLKPEGFLIITLWRRWQKRFLTHFLKDWIKRKLKPNYQRMQSDKGLPQFGDIFVPWHVSSENITINRFYHLFSLSELENLLGDLFCIEDLEKTGGPTEKDNLFVFAQKEKVKEK